MARETKIGLLVGLAFIICFAVILSNRGREMTPGAERRSEMERSTGTVLAEAGAGVGRDGAGDIPPARLPPQALDGSSRRAGQAADGAIRGPYRGATSADGRLSVGTYPAGAGARAGAAHAAGFDGDTASPRWAPTAPPTTNLASAPPTTTPTAAQPIDPLRGDAIPHVPRRNAGVIGQHATQHDGRQRTAAQHTVRAGDTLSAIVHTFYGTRSAKVIDAVYNANRTRLTSPDRLRIGTVLTLPPIAGVGGPQSAGRPSGGGDLRGPAQAGPLRAGVAARDRSRGDAAAAPNAVRWYQVKKGDTYVAIARAALGDGRRWREIFDLNRDRFPDPDRIVEGVRIRLPTTTRAVTAGSNR